MLDANGNEIVVETSTTDITPVEPTTKIVEDISPTTSDKTNEFSMENLSKLISDLVQKEIQKTVKPIESTPVKPEVVQTTAVDNNEIQKLVQKEMLKLEHKMFLDNLKPSELEYLKDIQDYQKLNTNTLKSILAKKSLPNIENNHNNSSPITAEDWIKKIEEQRLKGGKR